MTNGICINQKLFKKMRCMKCSEILRHKRITQSRSENLVAIDKKKKTYCQVGFAIPLNYTEKIKENEKLNKYTDLARELKKLWNMKVTVIPIVVGALETIAKGLAKGLGELEIKWRIETI